jgi:hypothetical protein
VKKRTCGFPQVLFAWKCRAVAALAAEVVKRITEKKATRSAKLN